MLNRIFADGSTTSDGRDTGRSEATVWFDLVDPDQTEIDSVSQQVGIGLPSLEEIANVRLSGRFRRDGDALRLNIPFNRNVRAHSQPPTSKADPLGIVLTTEYLVTLHSQASQAVDKARSYMTDDASRCEPNVDALLSLIRSMADATIDLMEDVAEDLAKMSQSLFTRERHYTPWLRECLHKVGRFETQQGRLRNSSQGLTRMLNFISEDRPDWMSDASIDRVNAMRRNMKSLDTFDDQLTVKLEFLLDAILGFINTDQNEIMKVLTVASVAAIPPVILVGVWGMNFRHMPELGWPFGYPLALLAILLSLGLPLLLFKRKGWI